MSYERTGLGWTTGGANPLTGEALAPNQTVVTGPLATGPRQTVVDVHRPETWPRWIEWGQEGDMMLPVDRGTVAGGTWDGSGAQSLPPIDVTGQAGVSGWALMLLLGVVAWMLFGGRKSRGEW